MLGTSDAWSMSHLSHRPSEPAYYIVDWWILRAYCPNIYTVTSNEHCLSIEGYLPVATTWHLVLCFLNMKPQKLLLSKMSPWAFLELWLWWALWVFFCMPNYTWDVDIKVFVILNLVLQLKSKDAQRKLFLKLFKSGHN